MKEIDITDNSNTWRHWDPIPPAYEPCKNDREEREYDLALSDPNRCFGQGIKDDPLVVWIDRPAYINRSLVWAHNNFAKSIAKVLGFTHTWIIKGAHDRQYARDCKGRKIAIEADRWLVRDADMHITLRLGTDLYACRLSAHAYVVLDEEGNPARYMTELARRFKASGAEPQLEFWRWENRHRRFLPQRPVSLGPNWEVHANVGPYLDTYRPDSRRTCDTYTPRRDDTPPRESSDDDDDDENAIFEGAMTDELAEMVRRCNSAYQDYTEFHQDLVAMGEVSSDQVVELLTMREQIVTMQREVYREAKGLIM